MDGTKISANASKAANRTDAALRKLAAGRVAALAAAGAAEDELFGEGRRGDEVPPMPGTRGNQQRGWRWASTGSVAGSRPSGSRPLGVTS